MGALVHHISGGAEAKTFQPMNVNFGLFPPVEAKGGRRGRKDRYFAYTERAKHAFDAWLADADLRLDAVVVGGSALALLGISDRQTRDVDVLHPELPEDIARAARAFALHLRGEGVDLGREVLALEA